MRMHGGSATRYGYLAVFAVAGLVVTCASGAAADEVVEERAVVPYDGAVYYYELDYGWVFMEPDLELQSRVELTVSAGVQEGADEVAGRFDVAARQGDTALVARGSRHRPPAQARALAARGEAGVGTVRHDPVSLWSIGLARRLSMRTGGRLWVHGALAGLHSEALANRVGGAVGGSLEQPLAGALALRGDARVYLLQDGTRAIDAAAGLRAAFLTLTYRVVQASDTPALHGPEAGVVVTF